MPSAVALAYLLVLATVTSAAGTGDYYHRVSEYVDVYNASLTKIPGFVTVLVRDQRIQVNFEIGNGSDEVVGLLTASDGSIAHYLPSTPPNPTMIMRVRPGTVERLIEEDCARTVLAAIGNDISIRGVGIAGRIRAFIFRIMAGAALRFI